MWADMPSLLIAGDHRPHKVVQTRGGYARGESQLRGLAYSCCLEPQRNGYKLHAFRIHKFKTCLGIPLLFQESPALEPRNAGHSQETRDTRFGGCQTCHAERIL
jgi:hypothetical protein